MKKLRSNRVLINGEITPADIKLNNSLIEQYEIKRITDDPKNILDDLSNMIDLQVDTIDFHTIIKKAQDIKWTRDAFDRIIVANCLVRDSKLLTKDRNILKHFEYAVF